MRPFDGSRHIYRIDQKGCYRITASTKWSRDPSRVFARVFSFDTANRKRSMQLPVSVTIRAGFRRRMYESYVGRVMQLCP